MIPIDLRGARIRIRRAHPNDSNVSFGWFSDPIVTRFLPLAGKSVLSLESIQSHLEQAASADRPKLSMTFELESQEPIGCGGFRNFESDSAEISIVIGDPALWSQGFGAEALDLLLAFGFRELALTNIWLVVRADNIAATTLFRRFGFEVTEHQVAAVSIDGVDQDKFKMRLSRTEYYTHALKTANKPLHPTADNAPD